MSKTLIVETCDTTDTYEVRDEMSIMVEAGVLCCDDYKGEIIVYAAGRWISAHVESLPEV